MSAASAEPLVLIEDLHTYYGKSHILRRRVATGRAGRGGRPARPQRRGQEHHAEVGHGPGAAAPGQGAARRQADHRHGAAQARAPRHRLRARGPPHLPLAHGDGEPAHRARPPWRHRGQAPGAARQGLHLFPGAGGAARPGRRHVVRRRAADAGDRPRHDAGAQDHPARRADRRADAAHDLADRHDHRGAAQRRRRHPAGRAERAADARVEPAHLLHGEGLRAPSMRGVGRSRSTTRSSSNIWGFKRWRR